MSVFEKASRIKLRFASERGLLDAEDLWDLPLTELNKMAKVLNKDLASVDEEDFLEEETPEDVELKLEFDIVRHVLEIKKEEAKNKIDIIKTQRDLSQKLAEAKTLDDALTTCLDTAIRISGADCGGIYLMDKISGRINLMRTKGLSDGFIESVKHHEADSDHGQEGFP